MYDGAGMRMVVVVVGKEPQRAFSTQGCGFTAIAVPTLRAPNGERRGFGGFGGRGL